MAQSLCADIGLLAFYMLHGPNHMKQMNLAPITNFKVGAAPFLVLALRTSTKDIYEDIQTEDGNMASIQEDSKNED